MKTFLLYMKNSIYESDHNQNQDLESIMYFHLIILLHKSFRVKKKILKNK